MAAPMRKKVDVRVPELMYVLNHAAKLYFKTMLWSPTGRDAQDFAASHGLADVEIVLLDIGWAPAGTDGLKRYLLRNGHTAESLLATGLTVRAEDGSDYDRFRGRLMCPIADTQGRVLGFVGRVLDATEPKYLATRQTNIFEGGSRQSQAFARLLGDLRLRILA